MRKIRSFIAISISVKAREALDAVAQELAPHVPEKSVNWVTPDRMHLTLRFLGDTDVNRLDVVARELDKAVVQHEPFTLELDELGCFPNKKRPRVIWVGVKGDLEKVKTLKRTIDETLVPLGWAREDRAFHAHLTLGRVKHSYHQIKLPWGQPVVPEEIPVTSVHLMESELQPDGPVYKVRHTSKLAETGD